MSNILQKKKPFTSSAIIFFFILGLWGTSPAQAAEISVDIPKQSWSFKWNGLQAGLFDQEALRRGFQVYREVCSGCHSLRQVAYRNLLDIGFSEEEVKEIAAESEVSDGPDDEGEMFMRPALPADKMVPPFPNEQAARAANSGAYPPDLSLVIKSRKNGADYLYAFLSGYQDEPSEEFLDWYKQAHKSDDKPDGVDFVLDDGMYFNPYFSSGNFAIAMPAPLFEDGIEYADGTAATIEQQARDVVSFLAWAASPELEKRTSLGIKVLFFLLILTAMLYAVKRRIWSDVH